MPNSNLHTAGAIRIVIKLKLNRVETEKGATHAAAAPALIINSNGQSLPIKVVFASERTLFIASSPSGNDAKVGMEEKLNWQNPPFGKNPQKISYKKN